MGSPQRWKFPFGSTRLRSAFASMACPHQRLAPSRQQVFGKQPVCQKRKHGKTGVSLGRSEGGFVNTGYRHRFTSAIVRTGAALKNAATDPLALCRAFFASSAPRLFASRLCWIARCRAFAIAPAKGTQRLVEGRSGSSAPAVAGLGPCQKDSLVKGPAGCWLSHFGAPIS